MNLLNFEFLTIANLFILMLWPASGHIYRSTTSPDTSPRMSPINIILLIFTVLVVLLDIVFLVLKLAH